MGRKRRGRDITEPELIDETPTEYIIDTDEDEPSSPKKNRPRARGRGTYGGGGIPAGGLESSGKITPPDVEATIDTDDEAEPTANEIASAQALRDSMSNPTQNAPMTEEEKQLANSRADRRGDPLPFPPTLPEGIPPPPISEDNIDDFNNQTGAFTPLPTPAAGTTDPHPDNTHNAEANNQEAHTTGMDMGQSAETQVSQGASEDRPTYEGKANMKGQIMTKVIDALSDVMTRYLLQGNNRRHLKATSWTVGNVIPQVIGGDAKTAMDRIGFANAFMGDPRAAAIGGAMSMLKGVTDKMTDTPFEATNSVNQRLRDIKLYKGMDTYITKSSEGDSLVDKAKHYLIAEANHATTPNGNHRLKLQTDDLEEVKFVKHSAVMPYIVLACVFYKAYHQSDLDVNSYHGMFKDYILKRALKKILKDVLGLDKDVSAFAVDVLEAVPQELINAFVRNIDSKQPLFDDEKQIINNFVSYIRSEYRSYFDGGYYDAVRKFQGQNIDLVALMNGLATSRVLHLFATQIATGDNVVWEAINNQGLFLGLLELTAIHHRGTQDLGGGGTGDDFLEQAFAVGIVRFNANSSLPNRKQNKILEALKSVEREKTAEVAVIKKNGKDVIVVLKGSDFINTKRGKDDIVPPDYEANLENVAGSRDFYTTPRYLESSKIIEKAIAEAKRTDSRVSVVGYSLGGRIGLSLASHYNSVPFYIYEPVVPINGEMDRVFSNLKHANVKIFRVDNSSISQNLAHYQKKHKLKYSTIPQRRFSSHSVLNFMN